MSDLPPLPPCPTGRKGQHHISAILPGDDDHDVTFYCEGCGMIRRLPASGAITASLDDFPADAIERMVGVKEKP